jgi:hypothetical protein
MELPLNGPAVQALLLCIQLVELTLLLHPRTLVQPRTATAAVTHIKAQHTLSYRSSCRVPRPVCLQVAHGLTLQRLASLEGLAATGAAATTAGPSDGTAAGSSIPQGVLVVASSLQKLQVGKQASATSPSHVCASDSLLLAMSLPDNPAPCLSAAAKVNVMSLLAPLRCRSG